ncbi:MAG: glutamate racemase [Fidelibacterota bacterium]
MADFNPIGVFDSGLGGLTVVQALRRKLPHETVIYFGDTARVPYGNKSPALVKTYSREIVEFLITKGAKMIVVACNTASSLALDDLRESFDIPLIGVIDPGVEAAINATQTGRIGVIGTRATIHSGAYEEALKNQLPSVVVQSKPCPLFVPLVEEGWIEGDIPDKIVREYLAGINVDGVDTLILGCTHYPLLKSVIRKAVSPNTTLVDSAETTATKTETLLKEFGLLSNLEFPGELDCYVSDLPLRFEKVARSFLGSPVENVTKISLH